jgi:hypothetical protein
MLVNVFQQADEVRRPSGLGPIWMTSAEPSPGEICTTEPVAMRVPSQRLRVDGNRVHIIMRKVGQIVLWKRMLLVSSPVDSAARLLERAKNAVASFSVWPVLAIRGKSTET